MRLTTLYISLASLAGISLAIDSEYAPSPWSGWGGNINNNRWASANTDITASKADSLVLHCKVDYENGISAAPTLLDGVAYFPTWNGLIVAVDYINNCKTLWQVNLTIAVGNAVNVPRKYPVLSRTSPQISVSDDVIYFGTLNAALLLAVDLHTGKVLATVRINPHPLAAITASPTLYDGLVIVSGSSTESTAAGMVANYTCCSAIGNIAAYRFSRANNTFTRVWNTNTLPQPKGNPTESWAGASVWGGQPSIDPVRRLVFVGTGNVYEKTAEYLQCVKNLSSTGQTTLKHDAFGTPVDPCLPPDVWVDSILALELETGRPRWVRQLNFLDAWTVGCGVASQGRPRDPAICPQEPGPDADFGMAPAYIPGAKVNVPATNSSTITGTTTAVRDIAVAGEKNGNLYALDVATGATLWAINTGPGGNEGGISWGVAVDNSRVYFTQINNLREPLKLIGNRTISNSAYGAVDLQSGKILWETPVPDNATAYTPPTIVGDAVFVGMNGASNGTKAAPDGALLILNAKTGEIVRKIPTKNIVRGGIAVAGEYVLFGSGYAGWNEIFGYPDGTTNGSFHVYKLKS